MVKVFCKLARRRMSAGTEGKRRRLPLVAGAVAHIRGEGAKVMEEAGREVPVTEVAELVPAVSAALR